jgi:hypothetical protein
MENGDALYARIAELEKENKELQEEINMRRKLGYDPIPDTEESEECARCKQKFRYYLHDCTCDDCSSYFVCKDCEMLMEGICGKCEDDEEEEKVLEDLTCTELKTRLRAINKPVSGRKAELIKRIRDHEQLTEALFEED